MKIIDQPDQITKYIDNKLVNYFNKGTILPFLGAGFTKGCRSKQGNIPDGNECKALMKQLILDDKPSLKDSLNSVEEFDKVANFFYKLVPKNKIQDFISGYFTNVKLDRDREKFIQLNWPFIYTLNIDDAIERNGNYIPILPNKRIEKKHLTKNVFKLHGDANDEVIYLKKPSEDGLIFSRKQYLQSLIDNKDLLNIFFEDYTSKNLLFIGCSLADELDLEYILNNNKSKYPFQTDKIYVTGRMPDELEQIRLEEFGINICIVVSSYPALYQQLVSSLSNIEPSNDNIFQRYLIKEVRESKKTGFAKNIISGAEEIQINNGTLDLPAFFIQRTATKRVLENLNKESMLFLIGKRVSGKTFFLFNLAKITHNKNVYYFPSQISFDSDFIGKLLELSDSLIIFDTDTLLPSDVEDIYYQLPSFESRSIQFIFCINSSDRLMLTMPYTRIIDKEIIELDSFFDETETNSINDKLSKMAMPKFRGNSNLLSNILNYKRIYNKEFIIDSEFLNSLDEKSLKIFILNAVFDKVYSSLYRAIKIDYDNIKFAVEKSNKAIEFEFALSDLEVGQHASYKVITNSKSYLFTVLGRYILDRKNQSMAANAVVNIVDQLKQSERFKNYWKALIAFDSLNQVFYTSSGGARSLIYNIYDKLETLLYNDTHYWMQRGKCIFYTKKTNATELKKAIEYTKKVYYDSLDDSRMKINASFQISMIYNRLAVLENFKKEDTNKQAISWSCIALKENLHNVKIIQDFISAAKRNKERSDFYNICMYILTHSDIAAPDERDFLLSKIFPGKFSTARTKPTF